MAVRRHTTDLGTEPLGPLIIRLSIPGMVSFLAMTLYNVVNTFWVSRLGADAIAALTVVFPFQMVNVALGAGTGVGISSLSSRLFGQGKVEGANRVAGQVYSLSLLLGLLTLCTGVFFTGPVLGFFNALPQFWHLSHRYLFIISFGTPFIYFMMMANNLLRGSGDTVTPMYIAVASAVLNAALDPFLIFGWGPFPQLGVAGAALGTVITQALGGAAYFLYLAGRRSSYTIRLPHLLPGLGVIGEIYRVGGPAMVMQLTSSLVIVIFNHFLGAFGAVAIAAYGLLFRISGVFLMPIIGMSQGLMPVVGYNFGARNFRRMWEAVRLASIYATVVTGTSELMLLALAVPLVSVFAPTPQLLAVTTYAMRVYALALLLVGAQFMWITTLQALRRGGEAMVLSLLRQLVLIVPLMALFSHFWGLSGIWAAQPVSDVLAFAITAAWMWAVRCRLRSPQHLCADAPVGGWGFPASRTSPARPDSSSGEHLKSCKTPCQRLRDHGKME